MALFISTIYDERFSTSEQSKRITLWETLCRLVFQKHVKRGDTVLDLAAGKCEFINSIECKRKIAVDMDPQIKKYASKGIEVLLVDALKIPSKYSNTIDVVFISNFLEHLHSKEEVLLILQKMNKLLKKNGKIIILQPNISLAKEKYWNFIDHHIALNDKSVIEALSVCGFQNTICVKRFLPYSSKSNFPINKYLITLYLSIPVLIRPLAGQSLFIGVKK